MGTASDDPDSSIKMNTTSVQPVIHVPVMVAQVVESLAVQPGGRYVDCTVGTGGHAAALLDAASPGGLLLGIDMDPRALQVAQEQLRSYGQTVLLEQGNYRDLEAICQRHSFTPVHGVLFDLGISSLQLADEERGFSFRLDAPLDMRFGPQSDLTAADVVNDYDEQSLADLIWRYGEERRSKRIARAIVQARPLSTAVQLAEVVRRAAGRQAGRIDAATRTFQAIRIAVNQELENISQALEQAGRILGFGGRLAVISYHSLEDRLVKQFFRMLTRGCICPPEAPICVCGRVAEYRLVKRAALRPSVEEVQANPRSRSARLRVAERVQA